MCIGEYIYSYNYGLLWLVMVTYDWLWLLMVVYEISGCLWLFIRCSSASVVARYMA